jgi:thiamine biosynthesis lipoprotein
MMGTTVQIVIAASDAKGAETHVQEAFAEITRVVQLLSEWDTKSEVSRANRAAFKKPIRISVELQNVLQISLAVATRSHGAFDPTWPILRTLRSNATVRERRAKAALVDWRHVLLNTSDGTLSFSQPSIQLGLGGVAKGYIADRAAASLKARGITNFIVNAGGDLVVFGRREPRSPWKLAVQHPRRPEDVLGTAHPGNGALVTSGDYERYTIVGGRRMHHIFDPRLGDIADKSIAASVRAPNAALADALATAVFVLGPKAGIELLNGYQKTHGNTVAGIIVGRNGHISSSHHASRYFTLDIERITVVP